MMTYDSARRVAPILPAEASELRRDWARIIAEIKAGYEAVEHRELSDWKLGEMTEMDHSSIERLQTVESAQPKHYQGSLLLYWHAHYCGKIPISESPDSSQ